MARLRAEVSLVRLAETAGVELADGADGSLVGDCPFCATAAGLSIRLVTNPNSPMYAGGNVFKRKLRYLEKRGYTWTQQDDYWAVVPRGGP